MANKLRRSMHRRCLRDFHCLVLIILRPLLFSVWHFLRNLTLSDKIYHSKILKNRFYYLIPLASVLLLFMKKNTCYNLFSCRCLSPLLGIYYINIFYSVFFHYLCLLRCGRVDKWTSRRVDKLLDKKTKGLWKVDEWTSKQVDK